VLRAVPRYRGRLCPGAPLHALWLIFLMLGVGMSLPWLFVALVPKTAMLLPKPGRWMNTLSDPGLMMLASSLWLATLSVHLGRRSARS
jgi:suppressor for copper-sensitivity B